ncbi:MAG: alpha-hydroxy-acid oxidizing protein [Sphingomonadales bacterium]|jgi:L-lactate dehydrogenase (cytochrome)|nr:alpha-hydroxy-acid oxidizing protein [Sphingomonadales bacterium]MBK9003437.1 alpha-hydroxy-acid oxidizing protein [Sphingomonadales bacterium]MBK9268581.1 alpha-hydroxy-acid oxidizing protein [Sphingomonadales bacterium]MBP6434127.1 alpha-hydroxy-acid oxidizing protein [Sphingorhabdus sp.]
MRVSDCHNVEDFRRLAKRRLPSPVFHYIDGAGDDEITKGRNSSAFDDCDLVPNVLAGVESIDMSTTVMGKKIGMPLFLSPTALQRLFHWQGERAVAAVAERFNTWFGISSLATVSIEEVGAAIKTPKMFQLYIHKDKGLNKSMVERCKAANFDAITLTVDTIVAGNRERCLNTGFTSPPRFTPSSVLSYATHPGWVMNYLFREKFALPNLSTHVGEGTNVAVSVAEYFNTMLDQSMDWKMAEAIRAEWGGQFCLKGVMSVDDAKRAVDIGATAIMVSNHGGRQLDGSRSPFDQIAEIADAVGGKIDIICDGGVRRGTHVLKALAAGATACSGGRLYLYALAAAGEPGVDRVVGKLRDEIERGMKLMGVRSVAELDRSMLRWR